MRSSIACARCRRSKVKCINNGVNTTCKACETSGRECTYPASAAGGIARRESIIASQPSVDGSNNQGETPRRSRPKKTIAPTSNNSYSNKESPRPLVDALLDSQLLTPQVWIRLFEIFQQHFSTDLPFLHASTFLRPLQRSSLHSPPADPSSAQSPSPQLPAASPVLLLAFLALTARFHPTLVAHHSPPTSSRASNPIIASEYYAAAARLRLDGQHNDAQNMPTLERTQALLMLGFHEWGMCLGAKAWITIGIAIRSAQLLGLQYEQELDDMPLARSLALNTEVQHMGVNPDQLGRNAMLSNGGEVEQEIRRRTFWSCFIMDRYVSSGKYRPSLLNVQDLRIQLPSSDKAFIFGHKVKTSLLGEDRDGVAGRTAVQNLRQASLMLGNRSSDPRHGQENGDGIYDGHDHQGRDDEAKWEVGADEGPLARYIKILELWGRIAKWSCAGGRRREKYPPWDQRCAFYDYKSRLSAFKNSLPRDLLLSPSNIEAHIRLGTSTPYTMMHAVCLLCSVVLHREYVPFIALNCKEPIGPLDPPLFPPEEYDVPTGFWKDTAAECFRSARSLIDLLALCQDCQVLVETPIVGFAAYTVAFVGVYCINFPHMDPHGYMCKGQQGRTNSTSDSSGLEAARKALRIVGDWCKRLKMAVGWHKTIRRVYFYYNRMKKDYNRGRRAMEASSESGGSNSAPNYGDRSLREGGLGGGLEEYKILEKELNEFGDLRDEDFEMLDADADVPVRLSQGLDEASENDSIAVKNEGMELAEETPDSATLRQNERWNAINSVVAAVRTDSGSGTAGIPNVGMQNQYGQQILTPPTQPNSAPPQGEYNRPPPYGSPQMSHQQHAHGHSYPPNPTESAQRASLNLQQQLQHQAAGGVAQIPNPPPSQHPMPWTPNTRDGFLKGFETSWSGDDVAEFSAGSDWHTYHQREGEGWLSSVWTNGHGVSG
ncbi:hypothetical protein K469DRAFT_43824 [Zopfia rhizophila CBS 207.26]|uniref:Zn(2)-C6 fungal-type domain-containing protein n=1 Tax=Zopfia rhizophila CBS 207.26 TaxID=1314779 RepID=A0A6A6ECZ3_9PEZI|nr:hypothetical protein K469DRAFT_43824 [Zopfia rhizophila CBS 207.26]